MDLDSIVESVHRLLLDNLPFRATRTSSGWHTFNCPMCSDKRKRSGVITSGAKISFNCFNCKYTTGWSPSPYISGKFKDLVLKLGAEPDKLHRVQLELLKHSEELEDQEHDSYVYSLKKFETVE